jgi:polysaccharide deacetylase family protein (PEP-CTERM system associated)
MTNPSNILTVDVEDWYQLANRKLLGRNMPASDEVLIDTHIILDLLANHQARATFFVLGVIAAQYPELVMRIKNEGHEVATHGYAHFLVKHMSPRAFAEDLTRSIHVLEDIVQEPILGYRAPEFSIDDSCAWAHEVMVEAGLQYDSSIFPIRGMRYGTHSAPRHPYVINTPSGSIQELPLATGKILGQNLPVGGGGYLRLLPLQYINWGIRSLNAQGQPATLYVHPYEFGDRWLDLAVPNGPVRRRLALKARSVRRNLGRGDSMRRKFNQLLGQYRFVPIKEWFAHERQSVGPTVLSENRQAVRPAV